MNGHKCCPCRDSNVWSRSDFPATLMQLSGENIEVTRARAGRTREGQAAWLFSSSAQGTARPNSEVDFAIECLRRAHYLRFPPVDKKQTSVLP